MRTRLLIVAALLAPALAAAYPIPREGSEVAVDWSKPALEVGTWKREGKNLQYVPGVERRNFILAAEPSRGFARLRVHGSGSSDAAVAVLFRMKVAGSSPLKLEGYALAVSTRKQTLSFYRWDKIGRQDPGARVEIPALAGREELEVVLWMAGPNFSATVLDGFSKEPLGSVSWSDPSYSDGHLGIFAYERTGPEISLELFNQAELARAPGTPTTIAKRWLVVLTPEQALSIPSALMPLYTPADMPTEANLVMTTNELGLYLLGEHGIEPVRVQPGLPFAISRRPNEDLLDPSGVEAELRRLAERFPKRARLFEVGRSAEDRPLWGLRVATGLDDRARPTILLTGGQHANEASTPSYVIDAARYLLEHRREPEVRKWLSQLALVAVPLCNPDGSHAFWHLDTSFGRKNRRSVGVEVRNRGVDLNRNFPIAWGGPSSRYNNDNPASNFYFGPAAGSEPEVRALMALAWQERFVASISFHSSATVVIVPYTVHGVRSPEPDTAWIMAEEMIERLDHDFGGHRGRYEAIGALYPVRGVEKDWYRHTFGTMAYLVETPFRRPRAPRLEEGITHTRPAWIYLFERWLAGPSLAVRAVGGASRAPLEAVVSIKEIELRSGERWTTNPKTGWYFHYLPEVGTYTILLERDGKRVTRRVEAGEGVTRVVVSLGDLVAERALDSEGDIEPAQ